MRQSPAAAVQTAVYAAVADAVRPIPVIDDWVAAAGIACPYVALGATGMRPDDDKTGEGYAVTIGLHVWTTEAGRMQAYEISEQIRRALHNAALAVPGYALASCTLSGQQAVGDPGGASQVVNTYQLYVYPQGE